MRYDADTYRRVSDEVLQRLGAVNAAKRWGKDPDPDAIREVSALRVIQAALKILDGAPALTSAQIQKITAVLAHCGERDDDPADDAPDPITAGAA